jgi:4a-hydroxytetrahydrobiopterin dehydratase
MKPFSGSHKNPKSTKVRNAILMNQLATPGLGSLMAGRWLAGTGQLICSVAGCGLFILWFLKAITRYYGLMYNTETPTPATPIPAWMGWWGAILFVGSWIWSGITSIELLYASSKSQTQVLEQHAANLTKLEEGGVLAGLALLPQWEREGEVIAREFRFKDFPAAMRFVNAVAEAAEAAEHHPDIDIRWNKVKLSLTTHDAGGLTNKDFALAQKLDGLAQGS